MVYGKIVKERVSSLTSIHGDRDLALLIRSRQMTCRKTGHIASILRSSQSFTEVTLGLFLGSPLSVSLRSTPESIIVGLFHLLVFLLALLRHYFSSSRPPSCQAWNHGTGTRIRVFPCLDPSPHTRMCGPRSSRTVLRSQQGRSPKLGPSPSGHQHHHQHNLQQSHLHPQCGRPLGDEVLPWWRGLVPLHLQHQ